MYRIFNCTLFLLVYSEFTLSSCNQGFNSKSNKKESNFSVYENATTNYNSKPVNKTLGRKNASNTVTSTIKLNKKWQIDRVTKKQFEIINLLWQKTKIFLDVDYADLTCKATTMEPTSEKQAYVTSTLQILEQLKLQTSTPSYIEFYYLDQSDDRIKRKYSPDSVLQKLKGSNKSSIDIDRSNKRKAYIPLLFKIRVSPVLQKYTTIGHHRKKSMNTISKGNIDQTKTKKHKTRRYLSDILSTVHRKSKLRNNKQTTNDVLKQPKNILHTSTVNILDKEITSKTSNNRLSLNLHGNEFINDKVHLNKTALMIAGTSTVYDKVKFFEMYDSNTPNSKDYAQYNVSVIYNDNQTSFREKEKSLHQHVNIQVESGLRNEINKTRHVKKDIQNLNGKKEKGENEYLKHSLKTHESFNFQKHSNGSRPAVWSEFPFVAVYIYEPSQVHCDAASISQHWLLAAASCLSRHRNELRGGLSAFVTYCSEDWRHRISYVKRTLIHPRYQPRHEARHLFNAGVIQVVNSMADTCNGWAPVSLISHQFTADQEGSMAAAVGWGLDRYDKSFSIMDIPKHPLMIYEGLVYSESCPGNFDYRTKTAEDDIRNTYWLSLPPYLAEENDTVHGALLLIGGKLLALYLEEERRAWGLQSAQYAGVWRLLPWLADTAKEPDDIYSLQLEL